MDSPQVHIADCGRVEDSPKVASTEDVLVSRVAFGVLDRRACGGHGDKAEGSRSVNAFGVSASLRFRRSHRLYGRIKPST